MTIDDLQTLELIPLYSKISPIEPSLAYTLPSETSDSLSAEADDFDFPSTLLIFSETKAVDLTNRFRKDADAYYVEAKRSTVATMAQIPYWMYGVLVVLGWNEAMVVLFNPLYFAMLLVLLASSYVTILSLAFNFTDSRGTTDGSLYKWVLLALYSKFFALLAMR